ncbi:MAG: KH domain-containing protein, partial [Elusimicrobia bacterium]|nr:KH domain-containing protein [Elusimicrobiota bacterium]
GRGEGRSSGGRGGNRFERRPPRQRREKEFTNYERPEKVQCPSEAYEEVTALENQQPLPKQQLQAVPETSAQVAADSRAALEQLLNLLGVKFENMEAGWDPVQERLVLRFDSDSPALLIGKDGQTIEALQYVVTLMAARKHDIGFAIQVETGSYWTRLETRLHTQIARGVDMVKSTSRSFRMSPMSSMQRRFVHRVLSSNPDVETCSEGEGKWRKIVLRPRKTPIDASKPAQPQAVQTAQPAPEQPVQEQEVLQQQPQDSTPVEAAKGE